VADAPRFSPIAGITRSEALCDGPALANT